MGAKSRKSQTPESQLVAWGHAGGMSDLKLGTPAFSDPRFFQLLRAAVAAARGDDAALLAVAMNDLIAFVSERAPKLEDPDRYVGMKVAYEVALDEGQDAATAEQVAYAWRPARYRLSPDSTLRVDLRGRAVMGPEHPRRDRQEVIDFQSLLNPETRPGRPPGLGMARQEWNAKQPAAVADLRRLGMKITDKNIATNMGEPLAQYKRLKKAYGVPKTSG